MKASYFRSALMCLLALGTISCGGGGGSNGGGGTPPPPPPPAAAMSITTASILPGALRSKPYSTTLAAVNGVGALKWSIAPVSSTALFVQGLTIDANTGVISGTANFSGTGGFVATVTDSSSPARSASGTFTVTAYEALTNGPGQTTTVTQFQQPFLRSGIQGGVPPIAYRVTSGAIPPGTHFDSSGQLTGSPYIAGPYQFTVTAQDSWITPETATEQFTVTVNAPSLSVAFSLPGLVALNKPFNGKIIANGGTSPYRFAIDSGSFPTGLNLDSTGTVSGTPSTVGTFSVWVKTTDSSASPQTTFNNFNITVKQPIGRNDSPATATVLSTGGTNGFFSGSISPYIDPPNGAPVAWDGDFYKLTTLGGSVVHIETFAKRSNSNNPLDTVIEITDGNGIRLNACRQSGDTSTTFSGVCINDDISTSPHIQDSGLDYQVPGAAPAMGSFYVHVFDWRGDARPDMTYSLNVSGLGTPIQISPSGNLGSGTVGTSFFRSLFAFNSLGKLTWSIVSPTSLPPGLTIDANSGYISGTPTTAGTYNFTVQVDDAGPPKQTVTAAMQITVN